MDEEQHMYILTKGHMMSSKEREEEIQGVQATTSPWVERLKDVLSASLSHTKLRKHSGEVRPVRILKFSQKGLRT